MNKIEQILNTDKKEMKDTLKVFVDRKIKFEEERKMEPISLFEDVKRDFLQVASFKKGLINIVMLDKKNLEEFLTISMVTGRATRDNVMKMALLIGGGGITYGYDVYCTENYGRIIQHEMQHVFDNLIELNAKCGLEWENEYRAHLAGLIYSENKILTEFNEIKILNKELESICEVKMANENYISTKKIITELKKYSTDEEKLEKRCRELLNNSYLEKIGATYDEIIKDIIKM